MHFDVYNCVLHCTLHECMYGYISMKRPSSLTVGGNKTVYFQYNGLSRESLLPVYLLCLGNPILCIPHCMYPHIQLLWPYSHSLLMWFCLLAWFSSVSTLQWPLMMTTVVHCLGQNLPCSQCFEWEVCLFLLTQVRPLTTPKNHDVVYPRVWLLFL